MREDEEVFFLVTGTHAVTLTGNYVESLYDDDEDDYDSEEDDEDMDDDMLGGYSDEESDDLDDVSDPRVTELDSEDDGEEAPALVPAKKGKNKRSAEEVESLDALIAGAGNKEEKLSKKQAKKLKNNQGEAVASEEAAKKKEGKDAKKVQFAKELEQGPTGPASKEAEKKSSVRVVQGITIDDRKVGAGRTVKKGDTVGMRYIGKLQNGKQFDGEFHFPSAFQKKTVTQVANMLFRSQQEGQALQLQDRQGRGDQGLGGRYPRHGHRWRAPPHRARERRLRQQGAARHPRQQHPHLRRQAPRDQVRGVLSARL